MRKFATGLIFTSAFLLVTGGTALAEPTTVVASAGPVALPDVPVEVCVDDDCESTPAFSSVSLTVEATVDAGTAPTITPSSCDSGLGVAVDVQAGSESTTVSGEVTASLPDGTSQVLAIDPVTVPADASATVSVCAAAELPILDPPLPDPTNPELPPVPGLPAVPGLGGILGVVLGLVDTLLSVVGLGGAGGGLLGGL